MQGFSGASGYIVFVFSFLRYHHVLGGWKKEPDLSVCLADISLGVFLFCFFPCAVLRVMNHVVTSRFHEFMTSKSSLTAEKIGRDLISPLYFFRAWGLRAWLMEEYNLAYDL
jgi:hypothetical protein